MKAIILIAACMVAAVAGDCPTLPVVQSFDFTKYLGTWYQHSSFGTFLQQGMSKCAKAEYTWNFIDNTIHVHNSMKSLFGNEHSIDGTAVLVDPKKTEGRLAVTLNLPFGSSTSDVQILATDYVNYAIAYSCKTGFLGHNIKHAWVLTRKQLLEGDDKTKVEALLDAAFDKISSNGGPKKSDFWTTCQKNC